MTFKVEKMIGRKLLSIETGKIARQADGAVIVSYGDTTVLVTTVSAKAQVDAEDFFQLNVDYREKTYAAGKFPGGFYKREGKPTTKEILTMRLIDRPLRPLFPKNYFDEVQVMASVLSTDKEADPDILAMIGASASISISSIPFNGPIGSVRIGRVSDEFVINPDYLEREKSDLDLVVSGTEDAVLMVEAFGNEVEERVVIDAIMFGLEIIKEIVWLQRELMSCYRKEKNSLPQSPDNQLLYEEIKARVYTEIKEKSQTPGKKNRSEALNSILKRLIAEYCDNKDKEIAEALEKDVKKIFEKIETEAVRDLILNEGKRIDGRGLRDIRPISSEVGILRRTHGSALFTRGETQALVVTTLGTTMDEQKVDSLVEEYSKKFMLDYNFPPFCVGEVRPIRGPGRREIGHGNLAEKALESVLPSHEDFPYTIRLVSDILESNGSSSMATVCGGTLSMMDAGIPITNPVAGIAMGLIKEGGKVCILSDITGTEDHYGDMDFKVAGTQRGITALQMDIKIAGINKEIMEKAIEQAKEGRMFILKEILKAIKQPRSSISVYAPKLCQIKVNTDKIGTVIGPGGKTIKKIQEETGTRIEISDDGTVKISSPDTGDTKKAKEWIERLTEEIRVGKIYNGRVTSVKEYGAFVEVLPGQEGLVHISELSNNYVENVEDVVQVGQEILVKVIGIDDQKRIRLSGKAAILN